MVKCQQTPLFLLFWTQHLFYFVTVVLYKVNVSDDADMYSTYCMPIKMNSAKQTLKKENQQGSISYVAVTFWEY